MFNNVGEKIKILAKVNFIIGIIGSIISAIFLLIEEIHLGWLILVIGPVASYCSALVLYAIGETSKKVEQIFWMQEKQNLKMGNLDSSVSAPTKAVKNLIRISALNEKSRSEGSWNCSCGNRNAATMKSCSVCYATRPQRMNGEEEQA